MMGLGGMLYLSIPMSLGINMSMVGLGWNAYLAFDELREKYVYCGLGCFV
jgi:hypothetical protein